MSSHPAPPRGPCPDDGTFAAFAAGHLDEAARLELRDHAAECVGCQLVVGALRSHASVDASAWLGGTGGSGGTESLDAYVGLVTQHARTMVRAGSTIGRYVVERAVGAGAMGIVYAAHDPELERKVALKLLRPELAAARGDLGARVQQEARAMARLAHPNVVAVHDVGTSDGRVFVTMELVDGATLAEWLHEHEHGRDWRAVVDVFAAVARGLVAAHGVGLVHRDLKPQNILVGRDGRPRITDFGLARMAPATPASDEPEANGLIGTPAYMAPEQLRGGTADAASDQYAFCICLYEALHGRRPQEGADPALPRASGLPVALDRVVSRGLHPERGERFPSMQALLDALLDASTAAAPAAPRARRRPPAYLALGSVLVVAGLVAALSLRSRPPREMPAGDDAREATHASASVASFTTPPAAATSAALSASVASAPPPFTASARPTATAPRASAPSTPTAPSTSASTVAPLAPSAPPAERGTAAVPSSTAAAEMLRRRL